MAETDKTSEKRERFLAKLALGMSVQAGCDAAAFSRASAYRWRSEDPEFAEAWDRAIDEGTDRLEDIAMARASEKSDVLMIVMLKARRPEKYQDVGKLRVTGKDDDSAIKLDDGRPSIAALIAAALPAETE
jgi:hypothetical protein